MAEILDSNEGLSQSGVFVIIVGPNGVGKGSIIQYLLDDNGFDAMKLVRTTSRSPADIEREGVDYYFVSNDRFEELIATGEFVEWNKHGQGYYGTTLTSVAEAGLLGKTVLVDLDLDAALTLINALKERGLPYMDIFIIPVDDSDLDSEDGIERALEIIKRRLLSRNRGESEKEITGRLKVARNWLQRRHEFRIVLVNQEGDFTLVAEQIKALISQQREERKHRRSN